MTDAERDAALISRCREGEQQAFTELVRHHLRGVLAMAYRLSGNVHDADDIAQETFLRAHRGLPRFDGRASFRTWLSRITVNTARTHGSRRARRDREVATEQHLLETVARDTPSPRRAVPDLLDELSADHREVLVLFSGEGYSVAEIAALLSIPRGTVKSRICYAKRHLARLMKERGVRP